MNDVNSLSHTRWNCKYHIVFAPKYRRKVFYKQKREEVGKILRTLCEWKKVGIIEAEVCPGSCAYACGNPAQDKRIKLHGIFEGEEQPDDLRKIPRAEIQIQESGILVPGILRGHGGEECKEDRRVHPAPAGRRQGRGTADDGKYLSPFTGSK